MDNLNTTNLNEDTVSTAVTDISMMESTLDSSVENPTEIKRDATLDVTSLLKASKETPIREETPIEKLKKSKESNGLGLVVTNKELEEANQPQKIISKSEEDLINETNSYLDEQDKLIEAAQSVQPAKRPGNPKEMAETMNALDYFATTGKIPLDEDGAPLLVPKTDVSNSAPKDETPSDSDNTTETSEESQETQKLVTVLIDKTGFGGDFSFTPEEEEKLITATEIRLTEVEDVELGSIQVSAPQMSFVEAVSAYQFSSSRVPVVFPASRFKAAMKGLSYGELGDIAVNPETITFDQARKRLSVIYNKLVDSSIGKFDSFDDFLKNIAWVDVDCAIFALTVATFPELSEVGLVCQAPKCHKEFNFKYSPRTLLRYEKCSDRFRTAVNEVLSCPAKDAKALHENSPVRKYTRYRLPESKMIIEVGYASAYDYLYNVLENMDGDNFSKKYPEDINNVLKINTMLLGLIRAIYVPAPHGGYDKYTDSDDMINALCYIKADEIAFLGAILDKLGDVYTPYFELSNVVCPHCGTKTKTIHLDIPSLVFRKYREWITTTVNADNISIL